MLNWKKILLLAVASILFLNAHKSLAQSPLDAVQEKYAAGPGKIKVLIVPGHDGDPSSGGTEFKGLKEAELNLELGAELYNWFAKDKHFETYITRDENGYKEPFASYLTQNSAAIAAFRDDAKKRMDALIESGAIKLDPPQENHNEVTEANSIKLYGINKWATENNIDLVLHIHFNDYAERIAGAVGDYSGFTIYVPEHQLPNYTASWAMAKPIFDSLKKFFPVSNLGGEAEGIIEDQELIAPGANATVGGNTAAILIEYGYIYESQWVNARTRPVILHELAYRTYAGVKRYFEPNNTTDWLGNQDKPVADYVWRKELRRDTKKSPDVLALQIAFTKDGLYPPASFDRNDCAMSGIFGKCTAAAVKSFQTQYGLDVSGRVDEETLQKINELYSDQLKELADDFMYKWKNNLHYGLAANDDVLALQKALALEKVYTGPATGNFLDATQSAVIAFQKKHKFTAVPGTGFVGPHTREVLNGIYGG